MVYRRKIYEKLKDHLQYRQITVLTGMRRTGKTTLVMQLLDEIESKNKLYIDLENIDNQRLLSEENYDVIYRELMSQGFSKKEKMYIVIDELQFVKNAPSVLKYLYDHHDIKFIVTGSSSYYLKNLFTESLAGRKAIFELFPLDFEEFLVFQDVFSKSESFENARFNPYEYSRLKAHYEEFIRYGGFPEVVLTPMIPQKIRLLKDIVSAYINVDVASLTDIQNKARLHDLIRMLASRVGTKLDYAKISRLLGVKRDTVVSYINFLEETYFIFRVPIITNDPDREIVKAKKMYLCDTGIANVLAELDSGAQFENTAFHQLLGRGEIAYYSLKTGNEIDFILNRELALEAKESPTAQERKSLANLAKKAGIAKSRLIGRHAVPNFDDYIWGGDIR